MQNNKNGTIAVEKKKLFRHGELGFLKISSLPKGLKETKTNILMSGSHGNSHTFYNGKLYMKKENDFVFGYFRSKNTNLLHPEHSPKIGDAKLPDGNYQLIKQQEFTPQGLVPVVD
jgi:hypothetical protein